MAIPNDRAAKHEDTDRSGEGPKKLREYQLSEKLGEGGMGTVYRALHLKLDRMFAVKTLFRECTRDRAAVVRFQREMRAVGALDHPGIIRATDAGEVDGTHFLVTELVDGVDLSQLIEQLGPLPVGAACEAICQVADALQHVHEHGLVHRDIKPTNLMVDSAGQVKILDLGLALLGTPHGADATATGSVERSAAFMSPERLSDTRSGDIRSDIYSLGCTLFYLLAGTPPFDGDDYRTITPKLAADAQFAPTALNNCRSDVPPRVEEAIERMMARDPASRFRSPAQVVEHLREFAEGGLGSLSARASQQPVCLAIDDQKMCTPPVPTTADPPAPVATAGLLGGLRSKRRLRPVLFWVAVVLAIAGGLAAAIQLSKSWRPSAGTKIQAPAVSAAAPTRNASVAVVQPTERDSPAPQTDIFIGHTQHVLDLDLSHDGQWLLSGAADATVRLWDVATAQQIHEMRGHTNYVATVCFLSDSQEAISGGNDHTLRRWDLATGEQLMTYKGHASVVTSLTVSHDGQSFLSGSFDALINMWDRDQPSPEAVFGYRDASDSLRVTQLSDLNSLDGHLSWVRSVAFAGDSTKFISAGNEALLAIWDVATGTIAHRLVGHTQPVTRALFLPGDQRVVSASLDSTIRLWNAGNGQLLQTFSVSAVPVVSLAVSPDGLRLAATGADKSLSVFRLSDGQRLHCVEGLSAVGAVRWAPNGASLFYAADDHSVRRWPVPEGGEN